MLLVKHDFGEFSLESLKIVEIARPLDGNISAKTNYFNRIRNVQRGSPENLLLFIDHF